MIILDKPYVSEFLVNTLINTQIPVLILPEAESLNLSEKMNIKSAEEFIDLYTNSKKKMLYTNSENALNWIKKNLNNFPIADYIHIFKDKYTFRNLMKPHYPDYFFSKISFQDIDEVNIEQIPKPFVIKPVIGFFSIAVYVVRTNEEWPQIVDKIRKDFQNSQGIFPDQVLNTSELIIEEAIEGEEYAVDAFFDSKGNPVIVNIYHHYHADANDTGDRLYYTSKEVINENRMKIENILHKIEEVTKVKSFPMHLELRLDKKGEFGIIEANPMRFAGFCVGDLTWYAYKINSYSAFHEEKSPQWEEILKERDESIHAFVLGDFPKGIIPSQVDSIDYNMFKSKFSHLIDMRKINYREYPIFSITFAQFNSKNSLEMQRLVKDDFLDVIKLKSNYSNQ